MGIAREEIFGPVLVTMPPSDDEEAMAIANGTDYGLGGGRLDHRPARAHRVAATSTPAGLGQQLRRVESALSLRRRGQYG